MMPDHEVSGIIYGIMEETMNQSALTARVRTTRGKGAARKLRRNNQVPAIFYGPKTEPIMLAVDYPELRRILKQGSGENTLIDLQIQSDHGTETRKAMLKEVLADTIKDTYLHADFYEISMDKEITVDVPIRLINTPAGVSQGGVLQHIKREITISCLPDRLMDSIEVDVGGLDIGDSLHIRDIHLPEGVKPVDEPHLTIAVVAAPSVQTAEEMEAGEGEEEGAEEETAASETGGAGEDGKGE